MEFLNIQSVVDNVPAMLYVYAVNHDTGESSFPFVSDYCEEMFGFSASVVMEDPKILVNAILEEEAQQYAEAVMESMENLSPFDRLGRMRRADGRIINVHYKSRPRLVEEKDKKTGKTTTLTVWDGIVFDVTRQVSNEESNRTKLQQMIDHSTPPVFEIDVDGQVTEWNLPMESLTGYSHQEVLGQSLVNYMPEEERGSFAAFVSQADNHNKETTDETAENDDAQAQHDCVFLTKEKKLIYLHAKCTISRDANWSETGRLFCCQDITQIMEAEKQKDAALKLVDAERGLAEWLSHEVRNPLSVAMEAVMALREGNECCQPENLNYIDLVAESIRYIVDLLTNMLDLNKCLEGKITLKPIVCGVREEVLFPTVRMLCLQSSKVQLTLADGPEVTASIDKLRLRQVLTNLITNAKKFTHEGFVRVELREEVSSRNKRMMFISVSDSGCGVKPSDYDALFSKWEQLGSQANGAGIGLCLSRALVRAMGGDIYLNKNYFSGFEDFPGAQFVVQIPLSSILVGGDRVPAFESLSARVLASKGVRRQESNIASTAEADSLDGESKSADLYVSGFSEPAEGRLVLSESTIGGKYHILVVDDDKMGRKLLKKRFQRLFPDAEIHEVASGEEALVSVEKTRYDMITMDHFMDINEMSGEETIRALRSRNVDGLIIGISGNAKEKEHLAAGAEDFFQKPIPNDEVLVGRLLDKIAPPGCWKVLCVDDVKVNVHFLCRRLRKVAAPHFTSLEEAEKRWDIVSSNTGEEAVKLLEKEWFDLVIVDQYLGEGRMPGSSVARFVREKAVNRNAIIVLNSGSLMRSPDPSIPYDVFWPKPLPSTEQMRADLTCALLRSRQGSCSSQRKHSM